VTKFILQDGASRAVFVFHAPTWPSTQSIQPLILSMTRFWQTCT